MPKMSVYSHLYSSKHLALTSESESIFLASLSSLLAFLDLYSGHFHLVFSSNILLPSLLLHGFAVDMAQNNVSYHLFFE